MEKVGTWRVGEGCEESGRSLSAQLSASSSPFHCLSFFRFQTCLSPVSPPTNVPPCSSIFTLFPSTTTAATKTPSTMTCMATSLTLPCLLGLFIFNLTLSLSLSRLETRDHHILSPAYQKCPQSTRLTILLLKYLDIKHTDLDHAWTCDIE